MNLKNVAIGALATALLVSCGGEKQVDNKQTDTTKATEEVAVVSYTVNTEESKVAWEGHTSGVQVYGHNGVISLSEGSLEVKGSEITGGSFTIDMSTIAPLDSGYSEEHPKESLIGHLSNGDFFLVDSFPTSSFIIKSMAEGKIVGDLTVRGITHEETVENVVVETTETGVIATGKLVFDRQKYDVSWAHFVKDVLLANDITLEIAIVATK